MSRATTRQKTRSELIKSFLSAYLLPPVTLAAIVALWEAATLVFRIPEWLLPSPSAIGYQFLVWWQVLLMNTYVTFYETMLGFILAVAIGVPISIAITYAKPLQNTIYPIILVLQSVPKVAIAPIILLWFGLGLIPKIIIAFLVAFFPIVVDTATGMMTVDPELLDIVRLLNATKSQIFSKIRLPHSMPYFFSAQKIAITLSVVGAVIGEFVGANEGLGYLILSAAPQLQTALAFAAILILSLMGIGLFVAISLAEKILIPWAFPEKV